MTRKQGGVLGSLWHKKPVKIGLFIAIVIALLAWWIHYNRTPAEGVITTNTSSSTSNQSQKPKTGHYVGNTMSFDYPGNYSNIQNNTPQGLIVEQLSLTATAGVQQTRRIAVTVKRLDSGVTMGEDAAFKLRLQDTKNYTHEMVQVGDKNVDMFTKLDNSEITYFIPGARYYASISGTSANVGNGLVDDLNGVVGSFTWNQ